MQLDSGRAAYSSSHILFGLFLPSQNFFLSDTVFFITKLAFARSALLDLDVSISLEGIWGRIKCIAGQEIMDEYRKWGAVNCATLPSEALHLSHQSPRIL